MEAGEGGGFGWGGVEGWGENADNCNDQLKKMREEPYRIHYSYYTGLCYDHQIKMAFYLTLHETMEGIN